VTLRDTRLQAAIIREDHVLLVQCTLPGEPPFWVLPGGGREAGERDAEAVAREVREELGVEVEVGRVLDDAAADPPDGTYARWRTYACRVTSGEPAACGADGAAVLTAVRWLPLTGGASWDAALRRDPYLYPQLERLRRALGLPSAVGSPPAGQRATVAGCRAGDAVGGL
jgi:8-oxo-dGTP pyrophosphatase MutT (NUDIX family)